MSDDTLEVAVLASWLANSDFDWLGDVTCDTIPDGDVGRREADQILRLHAVYESIRREFPNLPPSRAMLSAFISPDSEVFQRFLSSPMRAACEFSVSGCDIEIADVVAAATLSREGSFGKVLVACDLLCQGYNFFSGDGRALIDEYRNFLPAISSYASAAPGAGIAAPPVGPGWWDSEGRSGGASWPHRLVTAMCERIDPDDRRALIGTELIMQFVPVALELGVDVSFLPPEDWAAAQQELERIVATLEFDEDELEDADVDPDVRDDMLAEMHLAYVIGAHLDEFLDDARGVSWDDGESLSQLRRKHSWISDQQLEWHQRTVPWPEGPVRRAIERLN